MIYKKYVKRSVDIFFALFLLIILFPILLLVSIFIKCSDGEDIIFKQVRLGKGGKEFVMYKFRSMCKDAELEGVYTDKNDTRVTTIGKILRATSFDEIPQLFNILKGDMSFIGPRPPLTYHPWTIEKYTSDQFRMFEVRPGISGYAQVNGRKNLEWTERIKMSVWYVDNISFLLDFKIALLTMYKILLNKDNYNERL